MIPALSCKDPAFLKAAYPCPLISLVDDERHIQPGKYISFDGRWRVWRMTRERVPIPLGAFPSIDAAIFQARR